MSNLLIIDDDPLVSATFRYMLSKDGHSVTCASSGRQALEIIEDIDVELIFCDMIMPDMEGLETITRLKQLRPELPVIAMSGGGRTKRLDFLAIARQSGACDTLPKPFTKIDVNEIINRHLAREDAVTADA